MYYDDDYTPIVLVYTTVVVVVVKLVVVVRNVNSRVYDSHFDSPFHPQHRQCYSYHHHDYLPPAIRKVSHHCSVYEMMPVGHIVAAVTTTTTLYLYEYGVDRELPVPTATVLVNSIHQCLVLFLDIDVVDNNDTDRTCIDSDLLTVVVVVVVVVVLEWWEFPV